MIENLQVELETIKFLLIRVNEFQITIDGYKAYNIEKLNTSLVYRSGYLKSNY